jgi:hypothetical protein
LSYHRVVRKLGALALLLSWVACVDDVVTREAPNATPIADAATEEAAASDAGTIAEGDADAALPVPTTCAAIHTAQPLAGSAVYLIDPDGTGPQRPFNAYCDMVTDEGGWTLLISLAPKTVTTGFSDLQSWPTTFSTEAGPPTVTGLYQGTLAPFHDVREEIASRTVSVYGRNKSAAELEMIRNQYGWLTRRSSTPTFGSRPACRVTYAGATDNIVGCTNFPPASATDDAVIGWSEDADPAFPNGCWFARGMSGSNAGGSSQCDGEVNGTRWARTWFR